jgi:hypothetical protein
MTELFRYGIGLMKLAEETKAKKQKLMVVDKSDKAVKEIVIPG